jgi:hypothetical protein
MSDAVLGRVVQGSTEGRHVVYHVGCLARDRREDEDLDRRATILRTKAEYGEAVLIQRRLAPDRYEYVAMVKQ